MTVVVSRLLHDPVDGSIVGVESIASTAPSSPPAAYVSPIEGLLELSWDEARRPFVYEMDVYAAPDGSRWIQSSGPAAHLLARDPAQIAALTSYAPAAAAPADVASGAPGAPRASRLRALAPDDDPIPLDAGDPDAMADAAADLRRLAAGRRGARARAADAGRAAAARRTPARRLSEMTEAEAGEADVAGFRLVSPTIEDIMRAGKRRRAR